jgi:hypothetical protein
MPRGATTTSAKPHQATDNRIESPCGLRSMRAAIDVVSCHSQIRPDENWVPKSPRREIPNVGAGDEIIQTHLRFRAMLTCRFARRPPCRSHVPGGALIEYPPPPHTELLAFDGTEGAKLVLSEETSQNFVRGKCVPVWCYSPRSKSRTSQGTTPLLQLAAHCGVGVVSRCLLTWITWHHLAAIDLQGCAKLIM